MDKGLHGPLDQSDSLVHAADNLLPEPLPSEPGGIFKAWFDRARDENVQPNPNAMTLATVEPDGSPSARIVLCKQLNVDQGYLVFHTNYLGRKGRAIAHLPRAAAVFHWDTLDKQVRIEGPVVKSPIAESDAYFQTRPWISRVGAWMSAQSEPISSRAAMRERLFETYRRFGIDPEAPPGREAKIDIPRPPHWGGFRVYFERVELWCAGEGRLHDRAVWTRTLKATGEMNAGFESASPWVGTRLQP
jgi:pyridoxamine 5'-phosphate oxidase